nr:hypothetical protein [Tanacetum cinerariifolium]
STDDEEYLLAYKNEKPEDIPWYSTDEDLSDDDDDDDEEEDDKSTHIEQTETNDEDKVMGKVEGHDDKEAKKEKLMKRSKEMIKQQMHNLRRTK